MNIKKIIYALIIIILLVYLNQKHTYCFETNQKILFRSSVEIGPKGQSYILPRKKGLPGETLQMGYQNQMRWAGLQQFNPETTSFSLSEAFLKTRDKCPSDTMFLPVTPMVFTGIYQLDRVLFGQDGYEFVDPNPPITTNTRGYCIVTDNGKWEGDENGKGVLSDWIWEPESPFYCLEKYQAYNIPPSFIWPRLYPALDIESVEGLGDEPGMDGKDNFLGYFGMEDLRAIDSFHNAVQFELFYVDMLDTYYTYERKENDFYEYSYYQEGNPYDVFTMSGFPLARAGFMLTVRYVYDTDSDWIFGSPHIGLSSSNVNPNYQYYYQRVNRESSARPPYLYTKGKIIHAPILTPFFSPMTYEPTKFTITDTVCNRSPDHDYPCRGTCYNPEEGSPVNYDTEYCFHRSAFSGWASARVLCIR